MGEEDYSYADRSDDEDVDLLRSHWFIVISIGNRLLRQGEDPGDPAGDLDDRRRNRAYIRRYPGIYLDLLTGDQ